MLSHRVHSDDQRPWGPTLPRDRGSSCSLDLRGASGQLSLVVLLEINVIPVCPTLRIKRGGRPQPGVSSEREAPPIAWMRMLAFSAAIANDSEAVDHA